MAIVVQVSNVTYGPLGLSYESVYVQLYNSEHPESEPCEDRKYLRSFKTLNRHIAFMESEISKLRQLSSTLGDLSRPDGDATVSQGDTCVTSAVYGPGEVKVTKELLDKATIDVVYKPKSGLPGCAEKLLERTIRNSCETVILGNLHPRSSISITVQEIQNRGSLLSCCINSTCMALLDSGVSMRYLMAAVSCAINDNGSIIMDPNTLQEQSAVAVLTFVFENCNYGVITVSAKGCYTLDQFQQCLSKCRDASKYVFQFFKDSISKKLSKQ